MSNFWYQCRTWLEDPETIKIQIKGEYAIMQIASLTYWLQKKSIHLHSAVCAPSSHQASSCMFLFSTKQSRRIFEILLFSWLLFFHLPGINAVKWRSCLAQLLISTQLAASFTHTANTSVWKVPQQDQCDPFFFSRRPSTCCCSTKQTLCRPGLLGARACVRACALNVILCKFSVQYVCLNLCLIWECVWWVCVTL